jgi:2-oxoglutarate ferredoxin oxidoreductase subunit beta
VCELLSVLEGPAYIARVSVSNPRRVREAKRALRRAFEAQIEGLGFSLVEVLSTCPTRWGMPPEKALAWVEDTMAAYYPIGEFVCAEPLKGQPEESRP